MPTMARPDVDVLDGVLDVVHSRAMDADQVVRHW
jgi:hypothetical protein